MTLNELIADARSEMNEPTSVGHLGNSEYAAFANRAQDFLATRITEADQNFFEESDKTLGFIVDQEEYDLPAAIWDRKITRVTRTDGSTPRMLSRIRFQEKELYHASNVFLGGSDTQGEVYYLRGNKLGLKPTPKTAIAANILIHYIQLPHELHWAEVGTPTSTTFVIPTATAGVSPIMRAGRVSTTPNYYVGAKIRMLEGTDRGLERKITAYNVATRTVTVDAAWTAANVQDKQYVILSPIPLEYHNAMYQLMLLKAAKKKGDRDRYDLFESEFNKLWDSLTNTIEPRTFDENQHVRAPVDQHLD